VVVWHGQVQLILSQSKEQNPQQAEQGHALKAFIDMHSKQKVRALSMLDPLSPTSRQTKTAPASAAFEQARPSFLNPSSALLDEAVCKVKDKATRA
jgi:hypothetical protein